MITAAKDLLVNANTLLVITGAGISAESGVPTFRGAEGLFTKSPELEYTLRAQGLAQNRRAVWEFMDQIRVLVANTQPNAAHKVLAGWENKFPRFLIATQNIDGLHQMAGSTRVSELHGSIWQAASPRQSDYTEDEGFSGDFQRFLGGTDQEELLRKWSEEDNRNVWSDRNVPYPRMPPYSDPDIRPNVLLVDEAYGNRLLWVDTFIRKHGPDTILVIGCSGSVQVLSRLLESCRRANRGCRVININPHESCIPFPHVDVRMAATEALTTLDGHLGKPRRYRGTEPRNH